MSSQMMMMLSALPFLLVLQTNFLFSSSQFIYCYNNNGNYTVNSTYANNLDTALSSLPADININGFYNTSSGSQNPDIAYATALCRDDAQPDKCRGCIQNLTTGLRNGCPNQRQAVEWENLCWLRYSNQSILMETSSELLYMCNSQNATNPDEFMRDLRSHLNNLRDRAANGGPLRKVAAGNVTGENAFEDIFALVQCTPDMSSDECSSCLSSVSGEIPTYCNSRRGGRILYPRCNLRYETYPFFNETRFRELDPVRQSTAPQPPLAPVTSLHPSPGTNNTTRTITIVVVSIAFLILVVLVFIWFRKRVQLIGVT